MTADMSLADDFPIENLPFGVVRPRAGGDARVVVRIGDRLLDLAAAGIAPELTARPTINALLASGRGSEVRERAGELLSGSPVAPVRSGHPKRSFSTGPDDQNGVQHTVALADVDVLLPLAVGDFVDFYASEHHATNLGRIMRPGGEPLLPNWRRLPVGYHGRSGTMVVSGTDVHRPCGLTTTPDDDEPRLRPSAALDFELEVAFIVGGPRVAHIRPDDADRHVFGAVLLNDWSARDIQRYEYQPLGPFLGKSFAGSISPWVVTLDALRPHLVDPPAQDPQPDPYLRARRPWALDLELQVELNDTVITRTNFAGMYWTFAQQLAHTTVNGATTAAGDVFGSGTVSGPRPGERGSMIELSWGGREPLQLADGSTRTYLQDHDTVRITGWCGGGDRPRIGFGDVTGTVLPALLSGTPSGIERVGSGQNMSEREPRTSPPVGSTPVVPRSMRPAGETVNAGEVS